jgi:hypothetical protein
MIIAIKKNVNEIIYFCLYQLNDHYNFVFTEDDSATKFERIPF